MSSVGTGSRGFAPDGTSQIPPSRSRRRSPCPTPGLPSPICVRHAPSRSHPRRVMPPVLSVPVWGGSSPAAAAGDGGRAMTVSAAAYIEHTFRFFKQVLGWTRPRLRDPAAADRWTWLILAAYTQLWLARRPGPPRVPRHPRDSALSRQRAETRQTRPRPPAWQQEPPSGHPPRRRQDRQARQPEEENRRQKGVGWPGAEMPRATRPSEVSDPAFCRCCPACRSS